MCGISGFNLARDESINPREFARHLLLGIEHRGRDATGAAFYENENPLVQKADLPASEFVEYLDMDAAVSNVILHTRWSTKGSPKNNQNNHPIDVNGIVGVHNGMIWNDDELFAEIGPEKRLAQVDSEAIFATLLHRREKATESLARIEGSAAVAWIESYGDPDLLHAARVSQSPFHYAVSEAGSFVFASEAKVIVDAAAKVNMTLVGGPYALEEGVYLRIRNGEIVSRLSFTTASRRYAMTAQEKQALNLT